MATAFWETILLAGSLGTQIEAAVGAQEPAFIAKYAFQLAQAFNLFYHRHRVLHRRGSGQEDFSAAAEPAGRSAADRCLGDFWESIRRKKCRVFVG